MESYDLLTSALRNLTLFCIIRAEFRVSSGVFSTATALNKVFLTYLTFPRDTFALTVYRDAVS